MSVIEGGSRQYSSIWDIAVDGDDDGDRTYLEWILQGSCAKREGIRQRPSGGAHGLVANQMAILASLLFFLLGLFLMGVNWSVGVAAHCIGGLLLCKVMDPAG